MEFNTRLTQAKLSGETEEDSSEDYTEFKKAYNSWLKYCNVLDQADVLSLLKQEHYEGEKHLLLIGNPVGKVEVRENVWKCVKIKNTDVDDDNKLFPNDCAT